jgi:hypothetical protein
MALPQFTSLTAPFRSRRLRLILLLAGGLAAVFLLLGFLVLPPVAKTFLENKLGEVLHREVTIERVEVNPFTLSAEIGGLVVHTAQGPELLGFDSLHVDAEAASLVKGGLVIRELRLERPRLRVTRLDEDRYDISDLIEEWSKPSDSPTPRFAVSNIQVQGGEVTFVDKPKGTTHTVANLALALPFVSSLPYQADIFVEPRFSATINGAPVILAGRSKPFSESHESELSIDLDRVDLTHYLPYSPVRLPFNLRGGSLDTELKLVFRQGSRQPATLKLVGALHIRNLALKETGGQPLLAWKQLDVGIREADLLQRRFLVDSVRVAGLDAQVRIDPEGRINWEDAADRLAPGGGTEAPSAPTAWSVGEVRVEDGTLRFLDQRLPDRPVHVLDRVNATVGGLSSGADKKLPLNLAARANGSGTISAKGEVRLQPLAASLEVAASALPLLPFQPYFGERLNLSLVRGQLSGEGTLDLTMDEEGLGGGFKGKFTVGDLHSIDKASRDDFLRWKSLFVGDMDLSLRPLALSVGEVALSDFYARLIVSPQGRLNLMDIVRRPEGTASEDRKEAMPIRIGKVGLQGGTVNFSDYFVKPNYTARLTRIGGRVTGLSSEAGTVADLELRGTYGSHAPVEVLAKLNPLAAKTYLDLKGEVRGVDLTTLSTYSGKYAGYAIEKGKLSLYVTYHLEQNRLTADNRVFLDQLTFGDRVDSPDATSLPVKLAIALLKNGRGEIDVNLPVAGSLDDPEFSLGGVIVRVIGNLVARVVTSPFALLGSMFGGGEELSAVGFAPGRAALEPATVSCLEALAKAMAERPALKLEITGRADPEADREGLKRVALERAARAEKQKDLKPGADAGPVDRVEMSPQEYPEYLRRAYREAKFPKPRNVIGLQKDLPVEEMEKLMLANQPVGEEELRRLAARRAERVLGWLVEQGRVPAERLFLLPPKVGPDEKGSPSRVDFSLR